MWWDEPVAIYNIELVTDNFLTENLTLKIRTQDLTHCSRSCNLKTNKADIFFNVVKVIYKALQK